METTTQNSPGVAISSPPAPMVGQAAIQTASQKSTEEQRAKWREKYFRKKARQNGESAAPEVPTTPAGPDPVREKPASVSIPAWNPNTLLPLANEIVSGCERADVQSLKGKAEKISTALAVEVEKDAVWNPAIKTSLATSGSQIGAKWLAKMGIREENAPEVVFVTALGALLTGRSVLVGKLDKLIAQQEKKPEEKKS